MRNVNRIAIKTTIMYAKKEFSIDDNNITFKKCHKVRGHCHYTDK